MGLLQPFNVYQESWPLLSLIKLLGLYPLTFFESSCMNYLSPIILLTSYFCLFGCVHDYARHVQKILMVTSNVTKIRIGRYYMNIILLPMIMITTARNSVKIRRVFECIDSVDKNMEFLNIKIDYSRNIKIDIVHVTTVVFVTILCNLVDYYGLLDSDRNYMYVLMWIVDRIPDFVNTVLLCSFAVLTNKIELRFREINGILNNINEGKTFISVTDSSDVNDNYRLILSKVLLLKLCKTVSLLNDAYGFQLKVLSVLYIIYLCLHICAVYAVGDIYVYTVDTILSIIWGTLDVIKLVYIIHLYRVLMLQHA
ncbi:uncharacterized protein LOC116424443 isoform X1 [Nomia melanderi]|uniref:uncharacterized protein LOC116424443 isoform X1 n=1 Tax=Nomia melanderi TaxID=2448451 RepID=UPI0013043D3B|nr:gustatory receptor for bitter taste 66a-like [Nomia melanderi]